MTVTVAGNRPLIGVVSDRRMQGEHPFQMVGEKYLKALIDGPGANPVNSNNKRILLIELNSFRWHDEG